MKVDLLVPQGRVVYPSAHAAVRQMAMHAVGQGVDVVMPELSNSAMVHRARNLALRRVRPDADYVLWCDDDMAPPKDALTRLLHHKLPVVSALCTTRTLPPRYAIAEYSEERDRFGQIERVKPDTVIRGMLACGMAFVLMEKPVLDRAIEFWLEARDWAADHERMFERMGVRREKRITEQLHVAAARKLLWEQGELGPFRWCECDDQSECGEDYGFCRNLIRMGVGVAVDTGCIVGHMGEFCFSAHLMGVTDYRDVRYES